MKIWFILLAICLAAGGAYAWQSYREAELRSARDQAIGWDALNSERKAQNDELRQRNDQLERDIAEEKKALHRK